MADEMVIWEAELKRGRLELLKNGFKINEKFQVYSGNNVALVHYPSPALIGNPFDVGGWQLELRADEKIKLDVSDRIQELKRVFKDYKLKDKIKLERVSFDFGIERREEEKEAILYEAVGGSASERIVPGTIGYLAILAMSNPISSLLVVLIFSAVVIVFFFQNPLILYLLVFSLIAAFVAYAYLHWRD
ncbi:MAG: hypothetical protein NT157_02690 [Candidatus Micrarchaeota archaeon]|nr:hypothetical protein [Candidatus Micrarchaeota archaeon]